MPKFFILFILSCAFLPVFSQELFVYTEPASNMAAKSIGVRVTNNFMRQQHSNRYNYMLAPEVMIGVSKKIMVHAEGFFSNNQSAFKTNGGSLYAKYRFYSEDEVHSHFRVAAYGKAALNNSLIVQPAINLNGQNSGYEAGVVATKLINKIALSTGASFVHATDNAGNNKSFFDRNALSYNFSAGKLMLPKEYTSYEQTNVNLMLEVLGQTILANGKSYLDLAPSVQFIIMSTMRVDMGYRFAVIRDLQRMSNDGFLLRLEYNFFNAYK